MLIWQLCISHWTRVLARHGNPSSAVFKECQIKMPSAQKKFYKQTKSLTKTKSPFLFCSISPPLPALGRTVGRVRHGRLIWPMRGLHYTFWPTRGRQCNIIPRLWDMQGWSWLWLCVSVQHWMLIVIIMYKCWKCFITRLIIIRPHFLEQKSRTETWSVQARWHWNITARKL